MVAHRSTIRKVDRSPFADREERDLAQVRDALDVRGDVPAGVLGNECFDRGVQSRNVARLAARFNRLV